MGLTSVVVNYRTPDILRRFLVSYDAFVNKDDSQLWIADVDPVDESAATLSKDFPFSEYRKYDTNVGYAKAVNDILSAGWIEQECEYVGIFNSDCEFLDSACVDSCLDIMRANEDVAVVGPKQVDHLNRITHGGIFGTNSKPVMRGWKERDRGQCDDVREAVTLSGSALFVRTSAWFDLLNCPIFVDSCQKIFGLGPVGAFLPTQHFYEETYFIYHLREHGYKAVYNGEAKMLHEWHQSSPIGSKAGVMKESQKQFRAACDAHGIERD